MKRGSSDCCCWLHLQSSWPIQSTVSVILICLWRYPHKFSGKKKERNKLDCSTKTAKVKKKKRRINSTRGNLWFTANRWSKIHSLVRKLQDCSSKGRNDRSGRRQKAALVTWEEKREGEDAQDELIQHQQICPRKCAGKSGIDTKTLWQRGSESGLLFTGSRWRCDGLRSRCDGGKNEKIHSSR